MERFAQKYEVTSAGYETPCWMWVAGKDKWGYGRFRYQGRAALAHRVSWELHKGALPDYPALEIDHLCGNQACVNPDHLRAVTQKVNTLRGSSFSAKNSRKKLCEHGHEMNEANTYIRPDGNRDCRVCGRERARRYRSKRSAA